jgi:hypothetical protein
MLTRHEHKGIISAVKRTDFVTDRMPYIILRDHWYDIFIPNVHAPPDNKSDDNKEQVL